MIKVQNKKTINNVADKSFKVNRSRNIIAVIAIALTAILFTSIFTIGSGTIESMQKATMRIAGGDGHAVVKYVTKEEWDKINSHELVKEMAFAMVLCDSVDNEELLKRRAEFWYYDEVALRYGFIDLAKGKNPKEYNEVIADSKTLELMGVPLEIGAPITLELTVHDKQVSRDFILSGWWESDPAFQIGQIFASEAYVEKYKDELYNSYKENRNMTGTISGYMMFSNSIYIRENLDRVIVESGFSLNEDEPNHIENNVNWAYMSTGMETNFGLIAAICFALLLIILTGYLIIYNIFQISVVKDIRFYGLLKTIGTTGKQLKRIIRRQALMLSLIGIPIGLILGFFLGKILVPFVMKMATFGSGAIVVSPNPLIFVGAAAFALLTVIISTGKPARIVAKVSPIEAIRSNDASSESLKKDKKTKGAKPWDMAYANIMRNKKRTIFVVISLCLCIVLTNTVFTLSKSVDLNKALDNFTVSDFVIGPASLFNLDMHAVSETNSISESFIEAVECRPGFEEGGRIFFSSLKYASETSRQPFNALGDGTFLTDLYGLEEFPMSTLNIIDGEIDIEKLNSGNYILEGIFLDSMNDNEMSKPKNHEIGEKVILFDEEQGVNREFTIMGHVVVELGSNTRSTWIGSIFFLPSAIFKEVSELTFPMSYIFNVSDDYEKDMETFVSDYTSTVEPTMNYSSKFTALAGIQDIKNIVNIVGGSLAIVIGIIAILNFINAILTGLITRKKEFAMIQSIGMTKKQLMKMLSVEGIYYAIITLVFAVIISIIASLIVVKPLVAQLWFTSYSFVFIPLLIAIPIMFICGIVIPIILHKATDKQSIVERLREAE